MPSLANATVDHSATIHEDVTNGQARPSTASSYGDAVIAPGDKHVRVRCAGDRLYVAVDEMPPVNRHRSSIAVLFH